MKKNYALVLFASFLMLCSFSSFAQIAANDDTVNNVNGTAGGFAMTGNQWFSVLSNDTINGIGGVNFANANVTQVSTTNTNVYLSGGNIRVNAGTPSGTYTIVYQICQISSPGNCDTATVTVNVCNIDAPVIETPNCAAPVSSLVFHNLPAGSWTMYQQLNFNTNTTFTGSGSDYTMTGVPIGYYTFSVQDASGCRSANTSVSLGYLDGLEAVMTGVYFDANSDGAVNVGDVINYSFAITNTLDCPMTNVSIDTQNNIIISGSPVASIPAGATDNSITGTYVLTQNDINTGSVSHWVPVQGTSNGYNNYVKAFATVTLPVTDGIAFHAFVDTNGNNIQDGAEPDYNLGIFSYEINNDGVVHHLYSYDTSPVIYESNAANSYTLDFNFYQSTCEQQYTVNAPPYTNVTVTPGSGITTYSFPLTLVPCYDVAINLYGGMPRPGADYHNYIYYYNSGDQVITSGQITFTKDPAVTITDISEAGAIATATGFTYNFTNLLPQEGFYIDITMAVPAIPLVNLGDLLTTSASISAAATESTMNNNTSSYSQHVVGSYDPNDKSESHGGQILHSAFTASDYLTYIIRFENTGTADAINVRVSDVLDPKLDETTIRMVDATHEYALERVGNTLSWKFNGIHLPPSVADTEIGKGRIVFQVKPKAGYAIGDVISNMANIYFDSNPAIATDPVNTTFVAALGVGHNEMADFACYPNPTSDIVTIAMKNTAATIDNIEVNDVLGKMVLTKDNAGASAEINLSGLQNGLYFIKVTANGQQKTLKVIKK